VGGSAEINFEFWILDFEWGDEEEEAAGSQFQMFNFEF
jgi:hypothetical protein